jgi:thioesterase domain-containing protein
VPAAFAVLPELPRTPSGKVDRRALARLDAAAPAAGSGIAPRDAVEAQLAAIWEDLLQVPGVGVRDSFFDLGGHSLLAVRLMNRIARQLGRELPLAALFRAPTIEGLAALLRAGEPPASSVLVPLAPASGAAGEAAPLFLVHPIGGTVFCYRELARHLAGSRPVYGLQSRGLAAGEAPRSGIVEMAADYLASVVAVQPAGPYLLAGWSFGGLVALEMARQLERLVDPTTVTPEERARELDDVAMLGVLARDLAGLSGAALAVPREELARLDAPARLDHLLARAVEAGVLPPDTDLPRVRRLLALYQASYRAALAYQPEPWDGCIQLFQAASGPLSSRLGLWRAVARGGLVVQTLPGDHYSVLREPFVARLAAELGRLAGAAAPPEKSLKRQGGET